MSHSVRIKTEIKEEDVLITTFQKLGWRIVRNSKARTYPSDPARNTVYPMVAVNPDPRGYDVGIKKEGQLFEFFCDFWGGSISRTLGQQLNKVKQTYAVTLAEKLYEEVQLLETLEDGSIIIECEDGLY